jgi:hypothetical protein
VWIDLLCIMAGAEPYGHLSVNNRAMSDAEVSRVIGMDESTYKGILYRLLEKGIPSKTTEGMIYSRRMVREHRKFMTGRVSGLKGGGNPALRINSENHKPEAINHIPETKGGLKVPYKGKKRSEIVYSEDFLKFWKEYPNASAKPVAFEAWNKAISRPPLADILQAIEIQKKSEKWRKNDGQYIPMASTWLNQCRWDDKPVEIKTHSTSAFSDHPNFCKICNLMNCDEHQSGGM